jgi:hypothetical protein
MTRIPIAVDNDFTIWPRAQALRLPLESLGNPDTLAPHLDNELDGTKPTTSALQHLRLLSVDLLTSQDIAETANQPLTRPEQTTQCSKFPFHEFTC